MYNLKCLALKILELRNATHFLIVQYDYKLFDTNELIEMIRKKLKIIESLEKTVQNYRNNNKFIITDLINEYINSDPKTLTKYSIIYKKNIIISTCRFFYTKNKCYLSLIYTHPDYRGTTCIEKRCFSIHDYCLFTNKNIVFISKKGKKICYNHIKKIINLYKDTIKKYDLHVDKDNIPFLLIKTMFLLVQRQ
jgi:hypothetical protein